MWVWGITPTFPHTHIGQRTRDGNGCRPSRRRHNTTSWRAALGRARRPSRAKGRGAGGGLGAEHGANARAGALAPSCSTCKDVEVMVAAVLCAGLQSTNRVTSRLACHAAQPHTAKAVERGDVGRAEQAEGTDATSGAAPACEL